MDILGLAIKDFHHGESSDIKIFINGESDEPMRADVFFREESELNEVELLALKQVKGEVLDVGAGAGCHSLILQEKFAVDAIEISILSCEVMKERGVKNILQQDVFLFGDKKYDTILLLMNGLGMCGTINETIRLFKHLKNLLNPGGIIIGDSSDVKYMYENQDDFISYQEQGLYYGEVMFELEYKNTMTDPFPWLFIDPNKMKEISNQIGFDMEVLLSNDRHQYLAKFTVEDI